MHVWEESHDLHPTKDSTATFSPEREKDMHEQGKNCAKLELSISLN